MDEEQLQELEMHIAAGTDFPTALAAMSGAPRRRSRASAWWVALPIAVLVAWWLLG